MKSNFTKSEVLLQLVVLPALSQIPTLDTCFRKTYFFAGSVSLGSKVTMAQDCSTVVELETGHGVGYGMPASAIQESLVKTKESSSFLMLHSECIIYLLVNTIHYNTFVFYSMCKSLRLMWCLQCLSDRQKTLFPMQFLLLGQKLLPFVFIIFISFS